MNIAEVANEFIDTNDSGKRNFGTFKESDFVKVSK